MNEVAMRTLNATNRIEDPLRSDYRYHSRAPIRVVLTLFPPRSEMTAEECLSQTSWLPDERVIDQNRLLTGHQLEGVVETFSAVSCELHTTEWEVLRPNGR